MHKQAHPWLPATPRERVFLFSLSLSLMLNLTVVMLLLTGDLPVLADLRTGPTPALAQQHSPPTAAEEADPAQAAETPQRSGPTPVAIDLPVEEAEAPAQPAEAAVFVTNDPAETTETLIAAPVSPAPEPMPVAHHNEPAPAETTQDDPPVTFFGVGVE